jgi:hypothetical protein
MLEMGRSSIYSYKIEPPYTIDDTYTQPRQPMAMTTHYNGNFLWETYIVNWITCMRNINTMIARFNNNRVQTVVLRFFYPKTR